MNTAKYWRVYYKLQELLDAEFKSNYKDNGSTGGVREQSSLPHELNMEAKKVATYLMNIHEEENEDKLIVCRTVSEGYHGLIKGLDKDLRPMIDEKVIADDYFLVWSENDKKYVAGFAVKKDGEIKGIFSLKKGLGDKIMPLILDVAIRKSNGESLTVDVLGDFLCGFYEKNGFTVYDIDTWDEECAPLNWNYKRFGEVCNFKMEKKIER